MIWFWHLIACKILDKSWPKKATTKKIDGNSNDSIMKGNKTHFETSMIPNFINIFWYDTERLKIPAKPSQSFSATLKDLAPISNIDCSCLKCSGPTTLVLYFLQKLICNMMSVSLTCAPIDLNRYKRWDLSGHKKQPSTSHKNPLLPIELHLDPTLTSQS